MLGWEFPPALTGGLGVACYHIAKELRLQANVYLIVPFAGDEGNLDNLGMTGLNQLEQEMISESLGKEIEDFFLSRVPVALSAYPSISLGKLLLSKKSATDESATRFTTWTDVADYFKTRDLYGWDILESTHL